MQPKDNKSCKICGSHSSVAEDSKGTTVIQNIENHLASDTVNIPEDWNHHS